MSPKNSFGAASTLKVGDSSYSFYCLEALDKSGVANTSQNPAIRSEFCWKICCGLKTTARSKLPISSMSLAGKRTGNRAKFSSVPLGCSCRTSPEFPPSPTSQQCATRSPERGGDPKLANPLIPADLVIDHSVMVDHFGSHEAFGLNALLEFQRNRERYALLRWGQKAFAQFPRCPARTPASSTRSTSNTLRRSCSPIKARGQANYPDTVMGTDSHTTMINGLGVVGWGVGGIEAEACMLGQPISMLLPEVVGFKLTGELAEGATATDLVLMVTQMLRKKGVVGKFVEFYGDGVSALALADRATIANMAPEYGATIGFFPVDDKTLDYLRMSNRPPELIDLVETYYKEQGMFLTQSSPDPVYSDTLELDLDEVVPSLAGPKRPQDRIDLKDVKKNFLERPGRRAAQGHGSMNGEAAEVQDGSVVIAAITSCTNTSNPSVMLAAGLLAKKAVEKV